jgi:hypothetical protein
VASVVLKRPGMMRSPGLLVVLLSSSVALAQQPAPPPEGECTVTTTVKCTGAAAPYAIEAVKPEPIVVAPPPPVAAPAPAPAPLPPPVYVLDPRQLGDGWRMVQGSDGLLYRERKVSTDSPAVWGTGMAFWLGGYAAAIIGGMQQGGGGYFGWWPVIGAFINTSFTSGTTQALWAIDGIAQAGGFVTFLVGLAAGPDKIERRPLTVAPTTFVGGGSGVALSGRF